jgi:hypothetical protein
MKLGRLLAVAGLGYGAYRWLRTRPQTMGRVSDAIRQVGSAARRGDLGQARTALTGLGEAIGRDRSIQRLSDRLQQAATDIGGRLQAAVGGTTDRAPGTVLPLDAAAAGAIIPVCAAIVQASRLATERGTTQAIRRLAERLVVQFDQIGGQLREFGQDVPQGLDDTGQRLIDGLSDLAGNLFDQAFLDETMNAVIRIIDRLPDEADGLGVRLRQLQADIQQLGETAIHRREAAMPGPGTTESVEHEP